MKSTLFIVLFIFSTQLLAREPLPQGATPEILQRISEHNKTFAEFENFSSELNASTSRSTNVVPFAEYEKTGYIFFNDDDFRGHAKNIKEAIARNLPKDVTLVVYSTTGSANYLKRLKRRYAQIINESRLIVLKIPKTGSSDFWTRDNLPVPVWTEGQFTLVDAQYYYNFEPDSFLTNLFSTIMTEHPYFFEGGNFIANSRGECIVVNRKKAYPGGVSDTAAIPDSIFRNQYGCKKLTRFKHLKGIGHADEVVKFMSDDVIVTDTHQYVDQLEALGYEVHMLPEPDLNYETYVNSLQVNNVLFVPKFGEGGDQKAVKIYQNINPKLKIITLPTRGLATRGQGGIHCITMNYPPATMKDMVRELKAQVID